MGVEGGGREEQEEVNSPLELGGIVRGQEGVICGFGDFSGNSWESVESMGESISPLLST